MRGTLGKFWRQDDGLAAVEFALISPVLIMMLIGMMDFGMFINQRMQLQNTARAAGEYILRGGKDENVLQDVVLQPLDIEEAELEETTTEAARICECENGEVVECTASCPNGEYRRQYYTFSMTRNYTPIFPYPGVAEIIPITGSIRVQIE